MKKLMLTACAILILFSSCDTNSCSSSKERFTKKFSSLIEDASESDLKFSDDRWERQDQKFEQFVTNSYPEVDVEMSFSEKTEFWQGTLSYLVSRYGGSLITELSDPNAQNEIIQIVKEGAIAVLGGLEEIIIYIKEELLENGGLKDLFKEAQDGIKDLIESIEEDM
jgi:hypothetical protein